MIFLSQLLFIWVFFGDDGPLLKANTPPTVSISASPVSLKELPSVLFPSNPFS